MSDPYSAIPSTGKLKLKGVKDSKIDKKKKKKKSNPKIEGEDGAEEFQDKSVMLRKLEDEDAQITKGEHQATSLVDGKQVGPGAGIEDEEVSERIKTDAEKRFDEQRRKRLDERLKREGVKTHKQRVEELNRYLSGLSEHHDMPRIGPG
jgi:protein FAM32A